MDMAALRGNTAACSAKVCSSGGRQSRSHQCRGGWSAQSNRARQAEPGPDRRWLRQPRQGPGRPRSRQTWKLPRHPRSSVQRVSVCWHWQARARRTNGPADAPATKNVDGSCRAGVCRYNKTTGAVRVNEGLAKTAAQFENPVRYVDGNGRRAVYTARAGNPPN